MLFLRHTKETARSRDIRLNALVVLQRHYSTLQRVVFNLISSLKILPLSYKPHLKIIISIKHDIPKISKVLNKLIYLVRLMQNGSTIFSHKHKPIE